MDLSLLFHYLLHETVKTRKVQSISGVVEYQLVFGNFTANVYEHDWARNKTWMDWNLFFRWSICEVSRVSSSWWNFELMDLSLAARRVASCNHRIPSPWFTLKCNPFVRQMMHSIIITREVFESQHLRGHLRSLKHNSKNTFTKEWKEMKKITSETTLSHWRGGRGNSVRMLHTQGCLVVIEWSLLEWQSWRRGVRPPPSFGRPGKKFERLWTPHPCHNFVLVLSCHINLLWEDNVWGQNLSFLLLQVQGNRQCVITMQYDISNDRKVCRFWNVLSAVFHRRWRMKA